MEIFNLVIGAVVYVFFLSWWIILPIIGFFLLRDRWLVYVRTLFVDNIEWITLEMNVPREVLKTPKAWEEIFNNVYAIYSYGIKFWDKWWEGKVEQRISFEMVGMNGGMYFFIRTPKDYKNLLESAVYAQFPDAEIAEVEDYMEILPPALPNKTYDLWGTEMQLVKDNSIPIRTYNRFEDSIEERRIDSISVMAETISGLRPEEYILFQLIVSPAGKLTGLDIKKEGGKVVEEVMKGNGDKKGGGKGGLFSSDVWSGLAEFFKNLIMAPFREPEWSGGNPGVDKNEKKEEKADFSRVTEGIRETVKAIEGKISQNIFEVTVRVVYIDRQDSFSPLNVAAIMGYFNQFNASNLNGFKPNIDTMTNYGNLIGKLFPKIKKIKVDFKKKMIFDKYRGRVLGINNRINNYDNLIVLSAEELATLYHFPIMSVEAPGLRRLLSKKSEPPSGLPTS